MKTPHKTRTFKTTGWPLFKFREDLLIQLEQWTYLLYLKWFKQGRPAWQKSTRDLLAYPDGSLGKALGDFLQYHQLSLIPHAENHDVFHVLLDYGTNGIAEAQMQFCLIGNGKRSLYALTAAGISGLVFPEYWSSFRKAFRRGKRLRKMYKWYFEYLLDEPLIELKAFIAKQPSAYYKQLF